ncbi:hypothetical protein FRB95_007588 [Tulasnella sp. JGI-2019a]|nr:hypothetical protein FRB95_007588 [Tulasnella sp. JGI-2019a]
MSQQQSFYFDWDSTNSPSPAPITAQCDTLQINWSRQAATGPDPIAPYYLQIFTSQYTFPFQLDAGPGPSTNLTIPFPPGTRYQACMFDSQGNSGGCQAIYTVYSDFSWNATSSASCQNFTMPTTTLQVTTNFDQYSLIPSCSDLVIQPLSGTPPYQVTVAPSLQAAFNISNVGSDGLRSKLPLQWGIPFFVSMVDSAGLKWSYGPLRAGPGDQTCLAGSNIEVSLVITIASAVAALILGAVLSFGFSFCWRHRRKVATSTAERLPKKGLLVGGAAHAYAGLAPFMDGSEEPDTRRGLLTRRSDYSGRTSLPDPEFGFNRVSSPPVMLEETGDLAETSRRGMNRSIASLGSVLYSEVLQPAEPSYNLGSGSPQLRSRTQTPPPSRPDVLLSPPGPSSPSRSISSQHVYVVHHERGPASLSIYTDDGGEIVDGAEIVELPPVYSRPPRPQHLSHSDDPNRPTLSVSPIAECLSPVSNDLCTTPTGLIPPRGIGWTNEQLVLPPEKGGFRQVDS